jgi:hypothetical protein
LAEANDRAEQLRNQHRAEVTGRDMRRRGFLLSLRQEVDGLAALAEARA